MKVVEIKSITKEPGYIYYMNKYSATAVLEFISNQIDIPVSFTIEINPLGKKTIQLGPLPDDLNYPVMPVTKALKDYIFTMSNEGNLP